MDYIYKPPEKKTGGKSTSSEMPAYLSKDFKVKFSTGFKISHIDGSGEASKTVIDKENLMEQIEKVPPQYSEKQVIWKVAVGDYYYKVFGNPSQDGKTVDIVHLEGTGKRAVPLTGPSVCVKPDPAQPPLLKTPLQMPPK